jgi:hypothetical protein
VQISVQYMGVDNLWSQTLFYNNSYLMNFTNFRRWNYNCAFYYCYLIMKKIHNKQEQHFTFVRMGNLLGFFPNATPLVSRFRQNVQTFTVIVSNNYVRISGKIGFIIEDKVLIIINK